MFYAYQTAGGKKRIRRYKYINKPIIKLYIPCVPPLFFSLAMLLSKDLPEELNEAFFNGAKVLRALLPIGTPSGGKSPKDDCALKTPLV